jgi:excisionase family DNA binding protein
MSTATFSPDSRLVRVTEVARHLSLSRSAVYGLMDKGNLPFVKIGKCRRVPLEAVEKLVRDSTIGGNQ